MSPAPALLPGPPWGRDARAWIAVPAGLLALVTILGCVGVSAWHPSSRPFDPLALVLLLLAPAGLVLVVRGGRIAALGAVQSVAGPAAFLALGYAAGPAMVPLGFVVVALGATRRRGLSWGAAAAGVVAVGVLAGRDDGPGPVYATLTITGLAIAALLGEGARGRRERLQAVRAARVSQQESAVVAERLRIARELHDVLAHSLSGITVQAGVGLHLMDREPEAARRALAEIRDASRGALEEVRDVLGLLRAGAEAGAPAPRDPAGGLGTLVDRARMDGLTVDAYGLETRVPERVEHLLHRTLQEALTNVRRHAPGSSVHVSLAVGDTVVLEVQDDGPPVADVVEGLGLQGMRERAAVLGGELTVAPGPAGFLVRLELPAAAR